MKPLLTILAFALMVAPMFAQEPAPREPSKAMLEGRVVKDPSGEPLKKTILELIAENQNDGGTYTAKSDEEGRFRIDGIEPGRYKLMTERTGYVGVDQKHRRSAGLALTFDVGQEMKDLVLHMLPTAVILGRVVDEDGDPMPNASVSVWRRLVSTPMFPPRPVETAATNDLGEYRIGGLPPGKYYVSAEPTLDIQSLLDPKAGDAAPEKIATAYVTTYYPNTTDRAQAAAVDVHPGYEMPVTFLMARTHTARIRGSVANLPAGARVGVVLHARDGVAYKEVDVDNEGKFEFRGVGAGSYTLVAVVNSGSESSVAQQKLEVTGADIEDLRLTPVPGTDVRGRIRVDAKAGLDFSQMSAILQPADGDDLALTQTRDLSENITVKPDGTFEWKNVPAGTYYVLVGRPYAGSGPRSQSDPYLKSVLVRGKDVSDSGLNLGGGTIALELVLGTDTPVLEGTVVDEKKQPIADALVTVVPEAKYRKRIDRYQTASTDQHGHFAVRGLIPGEYTLLARDSSDDDDSLTDYDFLKEVDGRGTAVTAEPGVHKTLVLKVPLAGAQP